MSHEAEGGEPGEPATNSVLSPAPTEKKFDALRHRENELEALNLETRLFAEAALARLSPQGI